MAAVSVKRFIECKKVISWLCLYWFFCSFRVCDWSKISRATFSGNREQVLNRSYLALTADRMHFPPLAPSASCIFFLQIWQVTLLFVRVFCLATIAIENLFNSCLPWVPEVFFSRATGSFTLSAAGRHVFGRRPNWQERRSFSRGSPFKTWPKPETAHEKPLAPRVTPVWNVNTYIVV